MLMPSLSTRRIIQNAPTRIAAVQWMKIGRFAGIVGDLQELIDARVGRLLVVDRDVEVLQARGFDGLALFVGPVLGRLAQVQHRLDPILFEPREMLHPRLSASAELRRDLKEGADVGWRGLRGSLPNDESEEQVQHAGIFARVVTATPRDRWDDWRGQRRPNITLREQPS